MPLLGDKGPLIDMATGLAALEYVGIQITSGTAKQNEQSVAVAACNGGNMIAQIALHDVVPPAPAPTPPAPGPVMAIPPEHHAGIQKLYQDCLNFVSAEPVGSVLSATVIFLIAQLKAWFVKMGWLTA